MKRVLTFLKLIRHFNGIMGFKLNGPCLLDYLMIKLRLPVVLYVSFAVN